MIHIPVIVDILHLNWDVVVVEQVISSDLVGKEVLRDGC